MRHHSASLKRPVERRERATLVRFATAELEIVRARAREAQRPVASFIREAALGTTPRARPRAVSDDALRDLAALATSLDALARSAATGTPIAAEVLERARAATLELIGKLDHPATS